MAVLSRSSRLSWPLVASLLAATAALSSPAAAQLAATETGLTATPRPAVQDGAVLMTAVVDSADPARSPDGEVEFREGTTLIGTAPLTAHGQPSVAGGHLHSCVLGRMGSVWCWGWNAWFQLGDRHGGGYITAARLVPTQVSRLTGPMVQVDAGDQHTCSLSAEGAVWCWGDSRYGILGQADGNGYPVQVQGLPRPAVQIATMAQATCALLDDASVWCWGRNQYGQLGDGTRTNRSLPVQVQGLQAVDLIAGAGGGSHACARETGGRLMCWGHNSYGQLGDGNTATSSAVPVRAALRLRDGIASVALGGAFSCIVDDNGGAWCWGMNAYGQLGNGSVTHSVRPVRVWGQRSGVTAIAAAWTHACALRDNGRVLCWGRNTYGQIGDGSTDDALRPQRVAGLTRATAVFVGTRHSCALRVNGGYRCWGGNGLGQVGIDSRDDVLTPAVVSGGNFGPVTGRAWAWLVTSFASPGRRTVTATYTGSDGHAPSVSDPVTVRVIRP